MEAPGFESKNVKKPESKGRRMRTGLALAATLAVGPSESDQYSESGPVDTDQAVTSAPDTTSKETTTTDSTYVLDTAPRPRERPDAVVETATDGTDVYEGDAREESAVRPNPRPVPEVESSQDAVVEHEVEARIDSSASNLAPESSPRPEQRAEIITPAERHARMEQQRVEEITLGRNEVLLTNNGEPVGTIEMFHSGADEKLVVHEYVRDDYKYAPGKFDANAVLDGGVAGEWVSVAAAEQLPGTSYTNYYSNHAVMENAYHSGPEALQQLIIERPDISESDVSRFYAELPVSTEDSRSRLQYIAEEFDIPDTVPKAAAEEVTYLLPGLVAQESGFKNTATSDKGAQRLFQFMPGTLEDYDQSVDTIEDIQTQVEVAGKHFESIYNQLQSDISADTWDELRSLYSDDETFERELLAPLMINAYNTGGSRMAEVVEQYVALTTHEDRIAAPNVFADIALVGFESDQGRASRYGSDGYAYVPYTRAQARVLHDQRPTAAEQVAEILSGRNYSSVQQTQSQ